MFGIERRKGHLGGAALCLQSVLSTSVLLSHDRHAQRGCARCWGVPVRFVFFLHIQRRRLRMETHYRRLWCPLKEHTHTHTDAARVTFILRGWKEQQVGDGLRSIQVLRAATFKVRGKHAIHNK